MYKINKNVGVAAVTKGGWQLELNIVTWGGNEPKYDLRKWAPQHAAMSKGITMNESEIISLYHILQVEVKKLEGGDDLSIQ